MRTAGADTFIKINIHLDHRLSLLEVHEICDNIETEFRRLIPRSETYIHPEPQVVSHIAAEEDDDL